MASKYKDIILHAVKTSASNKYLGKAGSAGDSYDVFLFDDYTEIEDICDNLVSVLRKYGSLVGINNLGKEVNDPLRYIDESHDIIHYEFSAANTNDYLIIELAFGKVGNNDASDMCVEVYIEE